MRGNTPNAIYRVYEERKLIFEGNRSEVGAFLGVTPNIVSRMFTKANSNIAFRKGQRIEKGMLDSKDTNSLPIELLIEWDKEVEKWKKTFHKE